MKNVRIDERTILDRVSEVANGDLLVAHVVVIKPAQLLQYFWMRRVELEGALVHILGKFKLYNQRERHSDRYQCTCRLSLSLSLVGVDSTNLLLKLVHMTDLQQHVLLREA